MGTLAKYNLIKMLPITYHKATIADVPALVEYRTLFALELSGAQPAEAVQLLKKQTTHFFSEATANKSCISFIAMHDNTVAGIGSVILREQPGNFRNLSGKWGYIMNIYTVPGYRRNGICKTLLNLLIEESRKSGVTAFELHATKEGEKVYTGEGFLLHNEPTLRKWI